MYNSILYPTDGSEGAERAFEHVKQLGMQFDATVHVLFVVDSGFGETPMRVGKDDDGEWTTGMVTRPKENPPETGMLKSEVNLTDVLEREGKQFTSGVADRLADVGVDATAACRVGVAPKVIIDYAEGTDIDVIVMGTHGRSGLDRRLIGSVTEKVVRESPVPVLSVTLEDTS